MKNIFDAYKYLFYKCSRWDSYSWRKKNFYGICQAGLCILSFLVGMNFLTLLVVIQIFSGYGVEQIVRSKIIILGLGIFFLVLNYFILVHNNKYRRILEKYEKENQKSRIIGNIFVWSYVLLTFITAASSGILLGHLHSSKKIEKEKIEILGNQSLDDEKDENSNNENVDKKSEANDKLRLPDS